MGIPVEFQELIKDLAKRSAHASQHAMTEEATKTSVIFPFIKALGFDVFDLNEVVPEYIADVGLKKGEKVDFALKIDGKIAILIEAKPISSSLGSEQHSQLFRYFSVTEARIAILTNGREFWFYSDSETPNKMDTKPFFTFDIQTIDERGIAELSKFQKNQFSIDVILESANKHRYVKAAASYLVAELERPDDEFVKFIGKQIYDGTLTKAAVDMLRVPISLALDEVIRDRISKKLNVTFRAEALPNQNDIGLHKTIKVDQGVSNDAEINTTEDEKLGYMIVRAIAAEHLPLERVYIRDSKSYCAILIDDNNRRPLCRLYFNSKTTRYIGVFDQQKIETKIAISDLREIYKASEQIKSTSLYYSNLNIESSNDKL